MKITKQQLSELCQWGKTEIRVITAGKETWQDLEVEE